MSTSEKPAVAVPVPAASVDGGGKPSLLRERVRSLRLPEDVDGRTARRQRLPWFLCLVLAVSTGVLGYLAFKRTPAAQPNPSPDVAATADKPAVSTATATEGAIALESKGYIIPAQQILVSPKVSGMVVKLPIREGMRVAKDHVLAQLEDTDYQADNARAKATLELARQALLELERGFRPDEIAQAKAELAETEAQQVQAEAEWKRSRGLRERGVMSDQDFESAESRYNALNRRVERLRYALRLMEEGPRKERIAMARAQVLQAEADLAKTQWKLDNCTIRAPISGTILKKNAEEGNIVNPIAFNGSYSLCEMADLANLEVDLTIQERDIAQIFAGQKCKVRAEAFPGRTYEGVVSRLMPIADRAKGAIPVRVKVSVPPDEEGVYLKPEMGVVVSFLNKQASGEPPAAKATR